MRQKLKYILKNKLTITGIFLSIFLVVFIKKQFFNTTEFIIINHMTKIDSEEKSKQEYILVKNPPKYSYELEKLILDYNLKRKINTKNVNQLFLKEHDYVYLPKIILAFWLTENYSYLDKKTNTDKLDNVDFLAERRIYFIDHKKVLDTLDVWRGKYCYYEK